MIHPDHAYAAINNANILDNVQNRYQSQASAWGSVLTGFATDLFWSLTAISMIWRFGNILMTKGDLQDFFKEFLQFTIVTGFFYWLLTNGPAIAKAIIRSLQQMAEQAIGSTSSLTPSSLMDMGFSLFYKAIDNSSVWSPIDSATGLVLTGIVLFVLALIAINILVIMCTAWILMYAGIIFLGFGGSRWTSDMAVNYYRTVLGVAAQLFTMILIVGIGQTFLTEYYNQMSNDIPLKEQAVFAVASIILLGLVNKVPGIVASIASNAGIGGGVGALGAGAAIAGLGTAAASLGLAAGTMSQAAKNIAGIGSAIGAANDATKGSSSLPMKAVDMTATFAKGGVSALGSAGKQALTNFKEGASQTAGGKISSAIREKSLANENSISKGSK